MGLIALHSATEQTEDWSEGAGTGLFPTSSAALSVGHRISLLSFFLSSQFFTMSLLLLLAHLDSFPFAEYLREIFTAMGLHLVSLTTAFLKFIPIS